MPLILGNNGSDIIIWTIKTQTHNYQPFAIYGSLFKDLIKTLIKFLLALNLFQTFSLSFPAKGIQQRRTYYGSLDDTVITIEADESTPLLVDRIIWPDDNNNNSSQSIKNSDNGSFREKPILKYGDSTWSFASSSNASNGSDYSAYSTKSFKSHFTELRVLAFALILTAALSIAVYLLVIESRLPSITLSLDLVSHDIWSDKTIPQLKHLQYNNVNSIILMQTGNRSCDTSDDCLEILKEMENKNFNQPDELPYNFLIGGDGQAYEVRGWEYQSNIHGIQQEQSLVIGVIGNFDQTSPNDVILQTVKSLIAESIKRHKVNRKYNIYGLRRNDHDRQEGQQFFNIIMQWSKFNGFVSRFQ